MSYHPRRILPPGASRKRKERESFYSSKPSLPPPAPAPLPAPAAKTSAKLAEPVLSNQLLAGYLAHEFLTKGTLLGKKFDPARAVAVPLAADWRRTKGGRSQREAEASEKVKAPQPEIYAEVTNLIKSDGTHLKGIVNPSQLARWIQM